MPDEISRSSKAVADCNAFENNVDGDGHEKNGGEGSTGADMLGTRDSTENEREQSNNVSDTSDEKQTTFEDPQVKPMPIRKKHRRGSKRRKYKPYAKLSWEEKKALEERDTKRAYKMRERYMNEKGRPTAPYNTTQFLMAEHDVKEPDLGSHSHVHSNSESVDSLRQRQTSISADDSEPENYYDSPEDDMYEQKFFEKDFSETYEQLHEESLHSMSKTDLVREFIQLENRVDSLEKKIVGESDRSSTELERQQSLEELCLKLNGEKNELSNGSDEFSSEDLRTEVIKLRQENKRLQNENVELRDQISRKVLS